MSTPVLVAPGVTPLRYRTMLRSGLAFWLAPVILAFPLLFYTANSSTYLNFFHGWAPSVVTNVETVASALSYGFAAGLGVWEAGRLRDAGIWKLAPARSRYRIAVEILAPVVGLCWLSHFVIIAYACVNAGIAPDPASLRTLAIPLVLCAAWAAVGFAIGCRVWRMVAAPLTAVGTWMVTQMAWSLSTPWPRMLSGVYSRRLQFGEIATFRSVVPHVLCVGGIAFGLALLWVKGPRLLRIALAAVVGFAGPLGAYAMVRGDDFNPPVLTGRAPMSCIGTDPRVCMPTTDSAMLPSARTQTLKMLTRLNTIGVAVHPVTVTDDLQSTGAPAPTVLDVPLTEASSRHDVPFAVMMASIQLPCVRPDLDPALAMRLWVAERTGLRDSYLPYLHDQLEMSPQQGAQEINKVSGIVEKVRHMSVSQQADWFRETRRTACEESP